MRYGDDHKQRTRERVLHAAARAIRNEGPDRIGVAAVMSEAGLTHGGFYAHFASKEALIAAAISQMFAEAGERRRAAVEGKAPRDALRDYVRSYLSRAHRDARDIGCPLAALATDLPRMPEDAKAAFGEGVARMTEALETLVEATGGPSEAAGPLISEMVGALALARSVADPAQSDQILMAARADILRRLGLELSK
jgi:TetR/AcrR family transcriptional repressor of nem operon